MDSLNAGHCLRAQAFEPLMDGAFDLLFRGFEVVERRAVAVTRGPLAPLAANNADHPAVLDSVTAVIG